MSTDPKSVLSLPSVVGEETVINLQKAVAAKMPASGPDGFFTRRELAKGSLLYALGEVPDAIYMLRGGTIRLRSSASRPVSAMPVTTLYHAVPDNGANRPLLGARYFFSRAACSLEYRAETPCSLYRITSASLSDLHDADRQAVILMMYWLIASSDLSDVFVPIANKALGLERVPADDTQGLLRAVEEFRSAKDDARMPALLYKLYKSFMSRRMQRASDLGLEPSLVPHAPRMDRTT